MRWIVRSKADTMRWGAAFSCLLHSGDFVALIGELGAGKTTFAQAIAAGLGVIDTVTSPTFTLIQEYSGPVPIYHFDPYRLNQPHEIAELGLNEYLEHDGIILMEWANLVESLLPTSRFELTIEIVGAGIASPEPDKSPRIVTLKGLGKRPTEVVETLVADEGLSDLRFGKSPR